MVHIIYKHCFCTTYTLPLEPVAYTLGTFDTCCPSDYSFCFFIIILGNLPNNILWKKIHSQRKNSSCLSGNSICRIYFTALLQRANNLFGCITFNTPQRNRTIQNNYWTCIFHIGTYIFYTLYAILIPSNFTLINNYSLILL